MKRWTLTLLVLCHGLLMAWMVQAVHAADVPAGTAVIKVEAAGLVAFKKDFYGTLDVIPYSADPTGIEEGAGHSRVVIAQGQGIFDKSWVEQGVEFVAFRIHKNPNVIAKEAYFPGILGSRYAKVVRVIDASQLIVNFEYNGGSPDKPASSRQVSGYFFIDNTAALKRMVAQQSQSTVYLFQPGEAYVIKGMPNIVYADKPGAGDMWWLSADDNKRANLKISAEDAYATRGGAIPGGSFFQLGKYDRSIYLDRINILGPTFVVPVLQLQWEGTFFTYTQGQVARTLEIRNCNTLAEKLEAGDKVNLLPAGASWLAPDFVYSAGGGRRGDRGDGVIDMVGYQRFHLLRSTWISWGIASLKNNDGAGNWLVIDGEEVDEQGQPIHMVYEAKFIKRNQFDNVSLSFHDGKEGDARRVVRVESNDFSWPMVENLYWNTGLSTAAADFLQIEVEGFKLRFANNGSWRRELNKPDAYHGVINAAEARLFNRIPRKGDVMDVEHVSDATYRVWGWGVQLNDEITVNGVDYKITRIEAKSTDGPVMGVHLPRTYAHYWEISFENPQGLPADQSIFKATVKTSQTEFLLDGKPRQAKVVYRRDLFGHWQYNRDEVNYQFRNIRFNGMYRQTAGPADDGLEYGGLWEWPTTKEWVNCVAMADDGRGDGKPADEMRNEAFGNLSLHLRNEHPSSLKKDHHILIDGGRLFVNRYRADASPIWIRNRPTLLYGSASYGGPRMIDPVLLDNKGLQFDPLASDVAFTLTNGATLDLSNSTFGHPDVKAHLPLRLYGQGKVILNNVHFYQYTGNQYNGVEILNHGDIGLNLQIEGKGGQGYFHFDGTPGADVRVNISDWNLKKALYSPTTVFFSPQWKSMEGFDSRVMINGKSGDAINQ